LNQYSWQSQYWNVIGMLATL